MPIEIKVLHNGAGILYSSYGVLTGKDFIAANNQILTFGKRMKQLRYGLVDEMAIDDITISESEKMTIAKQEKMVARFVPYGVVVAVIVKNARTFGVWPKNSCGLPVVVFEQSSEPILALNRMIPLLLRS